MAITDFSPATFAEKNGRRIGTRITLANSAGTYITMELPIVHDQTVFWAAQSAKKALNMRDKKLDKKAEWFIERYDPIMENDNIMEDDNSFSDDVDAVTAEGYLEDCDGTAQYCGPENNRCTH